MQDQTQRFLFEDSDVRGEWVTLEDSYRHVLAKHPYPPPVAELLGELLAAVALLASNLKFDGLLVLQARSKGAVPMLMAECSSAGDIRGLARYHGKQIPADAGLSQLMPDGLLTLTLDPVKGSRHQGMVPLEGQGVAQCLSGYFAHSQQLPSRFWLRAGAGRARGLLLQALPAQRLSDPEARELNWQELTLLADTLSAEELLGLGNEILLRRLYHEHRVRLFEPVPLAFRCSCSRERSANALTSLGREDALRLVEEQGGLISVDCQFCNQHYGFDSADVQQLFAGSAGHSLSSLRH